MHLPRMHSGRRRNLLRNNAKRCFSGACPSPKGPGPLARNDEPKRDPAAKKTDRGSRLCTRTGKLRGNLAEQLPVLQRFDGLGLGCSDRLDDDLETPSVNQHPVVAIDQIHVDLGSLTPACLAQLAQRPRSANQSEPGLKPDFRALPIFYRPSSAGRRFESRREICMETDRKSVV